MPKIADSPRCLLTLLVVALGAGASRTDCRALITETPERIIVPAETQNQPGNLSSGFVFSNQRLQQVYSASDFSRVETDEILITGVAFRLDEGAGGNLDLTFSSTEIRFGVYEGNIVDLIGGGFAPLSRAGTVFSDQNFRITAPNDGTPSVQFVLDQPYLYDRRSGHLVFEFEQEFQPSGIPRLFDAHDVDDDRGRFIRFEGGRIVGVSLTHVTQFTYTAIPEPRIITILTVGTTLVLFKFFKWGRR